MDLTLPSRISTLVPVNGYCFGPRGVREFSADQTKSFFQETAIGLPCIGEKAQAVDGFGACFNELGWVALSKLDESNREEVLQSFFDPEVGANLTFCRMPIGANDFSTGWYSLNEQEGDLDMSAFSIKRDRQALIPFIQAAQGFAPNLRIWASPWCPPTWMKESGCYASTSVNNNWGQILGNDSKDLKAASRLKDEPAVLKAYALYFVKFVQAYQAEGITIEAVHPQNEVAATQIFPSCVWDRELLVRFISDYLHPAFQKADLPTEIWAGTMNADDFDYADYVVNHPDLTSIIKGAGFQWLAKKYLHRLPRPRHLKLMQTESECHNGTNNWETAGITFDLICHYFAAGVNSYMYWNFALDQWGLSQWGWRQNSLVSVNSVTKTVTFNPDFHVMNAFSRNIKAGALYLKTEAGYPLPHACFENPDGTQVILIRNNQEVPCQIRLSEDHKSAGGIDLQSEEMLCLRIG
jgi:glucosylceramidase